MSGGPDIYHVMKNTRILSISIISQTPNHLLTAQIKSKNPRNISPTSSLHSLSISLRIHEVTATTTIVITHVTPLCTPCTRLFPGHVPISLGTRRHLRIIVQGLCNDTPNFHMDPTNPALSMNLLDLVVMCLTYIHVFNNSFLLIHLQAFYIVIYHIPLVIKTSHIPSLIPIQIQLLQDTSPSTPVTCHPF